MSEPRYKVYDLKGNELAWSQYGVLWSGGFTNRLGEFNGGKYYSNENELIGYIDNSEVYSVSGELLGCISIGKHRVAESESYEASAIYRNNKLVGHCFPRNDSVAAASLALMHNKFV